MSKDRIRDRANDARLGRVLPRIAAVIEVGRPVESAREKRLPGEEKRKKRQREAGAPRDARHEPVRQEKKEGRRAGVGRPEQDRLESQRWASAA
jgi:hypothetical protein